MKTNPLLLLSVLVYRLRLSFSVHRILCMLAFIAVASPRLLQAQYSEIKMGEYLNYATAAANGGVYAGIDGIGYVGVFGSPALYRTNTGWLGLPVAQGFDTSKQIYGTTTGISHDGSVVAGSVTGTTTNGVSVQVAAYWVNGAENVVPAPPDDPNAITVSATGVSGDGTTLLVQDGTVNSATVETFVYKIASGTFTSLGFLGGTNHQTYATAISGNGSVVAGYSSLDNGNINGFIWTSNGVTVLAIPTNHPNTFYLEPACMSDDGATLYGRLTEGGGWVGFRYNTTAGYQDLILTPTACTADGSEAVGIENLYFPAVWSVSNGGGFLDNLVTENIAPQAFPTLGDPYSANPVTISPDGTAITALGPDAYPVDQIWYGTWQISLPFPLKTAAYVSGTATFSTPYQETLVEPAGTLTQNAEFNTGVSAVLVTNPHYASSFVLNADGSFTYVPKPGYISAGSDPETGTPNDRFTYKLTSPNGTSTNIEVMVIVEPPTVPTVDTPTSANVTSTTATLGGDVESDGGSAILSVGVVYAPQSIDSAPQIGDGIASTATGTGTTGAFTVNVSGLMQGTVYAFTAYASNSLGVAYSSTGSFVTLENFSGWQLMWFSDPTNAAPNADPYHTGVQNVQVFAYLGPYQDPSTVTPAQLPQVQMDGSNIFYSFTEPSGVSGITYGAQQSATMSPNDWQPIPDTGDPSASPPTHVFSIPTTNAHEYMRLTLTVQ